MEIQGEIKANDTLGVALSELAARADIQTIVEIGTWSGMGSTRCILEGILGSGNLEKHFVTFEVDADRHAQAVQNLKAYLSRMPNVDIVHGSLIRIEEMPAYSARRMNKEWYDADIALVSGTPCRLDLVPSRIDLLFIDGGEYAGEIEFRKLRDRSRVIVLDDTKTIKCGYARRQLLYDRGFRCLFDDQNLRNGCSGFERTEKRRAALSAVPTLVGELLRSLKNALHNAKHRLSGA
jgi:hypothetical protein